MEKNEEYLIIKRHVYIYLDRPYKIVKAPVAFQLINPNNTDSVGVIHKGNLAKGVADWLEENHISVKKYTEPKELDPKKIIIAEIRCSLQHPTVIDFTADNPDEATENFRTIHRELDQQGYTIVDYDCKNIPDELTIKCPSEMKKTKILSFSP